MKTLNLSDLRILVLEDDYILAQDICAGLEQIGAKIIGPFPSLADVEHTLTHDIIIDCAILDVNLGDELVYPLADKLIEAKIPIVFAKSYKDDCIPSRYKNISRIEKPLEIKILAKVLTLMGVTTNNSRYQKITKSMLKQLSDCNSSPYGMH